MRAGTNMNKPQTALPPTSTNNPFTLREYNPIQRLNKPQKIALIFEVHHGRRD